MEKVIIDGNNAVLGRVGSFVAKELLKGKEVVLLNCEKIVVSGDKKAFADKIRRKRKMGSGGSLKGPKYIRQEDLLVKRMIRGMLPWDRPRGRAAHKRLRCEIKTGDLKEEEVKNAKTFDHKFSAKSATIKEIVRLLR